MTLALIVWPATGAAQVLQRFDVDNSGTPYTAASCLDPPLALTHELVNGGPTEGGRFLRLAFEEPVPNHSSVTFDEALPASFDQIIADFDFRMSPGNGQADGIGFALLSTAEFGVQGAVCPQGPLFVAEEPNFSGSLGIGFDIHQALGEDLNGNHISLHFDGVELAELDATLALTLAAGEWIHARILMLPGPGSGIEITVILQQRGGQPLTVVDGYSLPGVDLYSGRIHFAARSGGESASHDIDNVEVQPIGSSESLLAFSAVSYDVEESDSQAVVTVTRQGDASSAVTVQVQTMDLSALAGSDYQGTSQMLAFGPGELERSLNIPLLDDGNNEGDEVFLVWLSNPSGGSVLGGPSVAGVRIIDDESSRLWGHWSHILSLPAVAVHLHLLPTAQVLFWQGGGVLDEVYLWDPTTGVSSRPTLPAHDIFCSGHSFLADGGLLVSGGHDQLDGVGLSNAAIYDPLGDDWENLPAMGGEGGRWYPTNTTLGNGDLLVLSGTYDQFRNKNTLPQVFVAETGRWRDLVEAQALEPLGLGFYPRMFLAPDGKVFKAGDPDSWFLSTSGTGQWLAGPPSYFAQARTYGPAVFLDGRVLLAGGGDPPTNSVEIIDLNEEDPQWLEVASMAFARRYNNATLLPDGTVLVTGGTSCGGFNCNTEAVLEAELWNPDSGSWATLAGMQVKRIYHSTALLLPDGRVLVAGGGRPAASGEVDHHNAEIFSPPYLFNGPRPTLFMAPGEVSLAEEFFVETPDAVDIASISLIRLGSVTHSFDQNQRFLTASFTPAPGGLMVAVPPNPNLVPPGHYMLFLVNGGGVPSVAKIVQVVDPPIFVDGFESGTTEAWSATNP